MIDFEQFEDYLANQLTADEKAVFEQRLKDDPEFAGAFQQYRSIQSDMQQWQQTEPGRMELRRTLQRITGQPTGKAVVRPMRWYLWRAAAMLIVAAMVWWLMLPSSKSNQKLYAEYASGETLSFTRGNLTDSLWEQAATRLYDKQYREAAVPLQHIISTRQDSLHVAALYLGYCYMLSDQDALAEKIFDTIPVQQGEAGDKLRWYKALLYLKTGREQLCRENLSVIASSSGDYVGKAKELMKALR